MANSRGWTINEPSVAAWYAEAIERGAGYDEAIAHAVERYQRRFERRISRSDVIRILKSRRGPDALYRHGARVLFDATTARDPQELKRARVAAAKRLRLAGAAGQRLQYVAALTLSRASPAEIQRFIDREVQHLLARGVAKEKLVDELGKSLPYAKSHLRRYVREALKSRGIHRLK